jgi:hypothetical protein
MKAVHINSVLINLNLADNQFGQKEEVIDNLVLVIKENPTIFQIDIKHNGIYEQGTALQISKNQGPRKSSMPVKKRRPPK